MTAWHPLAPVETGIVTEPAPEWQALAAALRQAAPALRQIALARLTAPSWQPGETAEHAAYAEGTKAVWRLLLGLVERETETMR